MCIINNIEVEKKKEVELCKEKLTTRKWGRRKKQGVIMKDDMQALKYHNEVIKYILLHNECIIKTWGAKSMVRGL